MLRTNLALSAQMRVRSESAGNVKSISKQRYAGVWQR